MEDTLTKNRRFLLQVERVIQISNNEVIHQQIAPITSDRMLSFAAAVAKLRANYIELAFEFADAKSVEGEDGISGIEELDLHRKRFEICRDAFIALQRAIELGYVTVEM